MKKILCTMLGIAFVFFIACSKPVPQKYEDGGDKAYRYANLFAQEGKWQICSFSIDGEEQLNLPKYKALDVDLMNIQFVSTDKKDKFNEFHGDLLMGKCFGNYVDTHESVDYIKLWNSSTHPITFNNTATGCVNNPFDQNLIMQNNCGYWTNWNIKKLTQDEVKLYYNYRRTFTITLCRIGKI